jgi:hypothetical protein
MPDDQTSTSVLRDSRGRLRPGFAVIAAIFIALVILAGANNIINLVS